MIRAQRSRIRKLTVRRTRPGFLPAFLPALVLALALLALAGIGAVWTMRRRSEKPMALMAAEE